MLAAVDIRGDHSGVPFLWVWAVRRAKAGQTNLGFRKSPSGVSVKGKRAPGLSRIAAW
jgi:hypothetical protein